MFVYADNAATTCVSRAAVDAMLPFLLEYYGNPSSLYAFGQKAQEALQESFLKAYTRYHTYRGESSEKTWLTHIVVNTCKDFRRSVWFRRRGSELCADQIPDAVPPPDEAHMDLMNAVMKLPVKNREVILLKYQQGMNNE